MYVEDWPTFYEQAEALYRAAPLRTRYVVKYKHKAGKLVLKVTDDVTCLKYATDQVADVKKMEKLNNLFFLLMSRGTDEEPEAMEVEAAPEEPQQSAAPAAVPAASRSKKHRRRG